MDDLISRKWLMECVEEGWIKFDTEKDENRFIHLVRDIAPSAEPEPSEVARDIATIIANEKDMRVIAEPRKGKWIPFSERLPEANRVVLLAFSHNAVVGYWIDILPDGKPIWYAATGNGWATDIDCENYGYPTAWMPVPELYKGGEEDEG